MTVLGQLCLLHKLADPFKLVYRQGGWSMQLTRTYSHLRQRKMIFLKFIFSGDLTSSHWCEFFIDLYQWYHKGHL